jgi:hypothetical protein
MTCIARTGFVLLLGCAMGVSIPTPAHAADRKPARPGSKSAPESARESKPEAAPDTAPELEPDPAPDSTTNSAPDAAADLKKRTGSFQIKIPQRCKDSAIPLLVSRFGFAPIDPAKDPDVEKDYDLAKESFEVYVPPAYTGKEPYGLIVWVSASPGGNVHQQWIDVLNKHKLIWVGANNSGNNRNGRIRLGLAVDAAHYMPTAYNIDKDRVYVSGGSGGGRCSSMLGVAYPEYFTGGSYPIIGCNFYRRIQVTAATAVKGAEFYEASFKRPSAKLWDLVTKERRHVYLTGDNDPNRLQTELNYKAAKKDGFKHITYIQVPGMGHQAPDAEWFEKGIVALDEGRQAIAAGGAGVKDETPAEKAAAKAEAKPVAHADAKPAAAPRLPAPVLAKPAPAVAKDAPAASVSPDDEADKAMKIARLYMSNRLYNKAREKLKQLVKDHPNTPQATEAQKLLAELGNK